MCSVPKITGKLLIYSAWYTYNIGVSSLADLKSQSSNLQMPKSHRIDIMYSGELKEEGSSNCVSQKMTISPKGSNYPTDLKDVSLGISYLFASPKPDIQIIRKSPCQLSFPVSQMTD